MKKRKLKKSFLLLLIALLIIVAGLLLLFKKNDKTLYSEDAVKVINENNKELLKKEYSKTLDEMIINNKYNLSYLEDYLDVKYIDEDNFLDKVNTYLDKGYKADTINRYISIKNINFDNIDRYNKYLDKVSDIQTCVTYVNIGIDQDYYTNIKESDNPDDLLVLVNKYNSIPTSYKPKDLTYIPGAYGNNVPVREVMKESFEKLQLAAQDDIKIKLMPTTAFRDANFQKTLYDRYVAEDGKEKADTYSARPGHSEHQTGLAIDLKNMALSDIRLTDENFKWLNDNAYKYGFIIRFPKDKENITGYQFENWHIRYVGLDHAKIIHDNNLTLEEYIDLYITKY